MTDLEIVELALRRAGLEYAAYELMKLIAEREAGLEPEKQPEE